MTALEPPLALLAELTHRCPLQCPYCSNPLALERLFSSVGTSTDALVGFAGSAQAALIHSFDSYMGGSLSSPQALAVDHFQAGADADEGPVLRGIEDPAVLGVERVATVIGHPVRAQLDAVGMLERHAAHRRDRKPRDGEHAATILRVS